MDFTPAYELGVLAQSTFVTQHSITLTGLNRETTYYVRLTSRDPDGGSSSSPNLTFTTTSAVPIEITSIQATVGETSTTISWLTNKPTTSAVAHGLTQAYERGVVSLPPAGHPDLFALAGREPVRFRELPQPLFTVKFGRINAQPVAE